MYNGIGLTTARGSGTNGFVQRNLSAIPNKQKRVEYKSEDDLKQLESEMTRGPNMEILQHARKRQIELKCLEMRELMEEQNYTEEEIEQKVSKFRKMLFEKDAALEGSNVVLEKDEFGRPIARDSHEMAQAQAEKNRRFKEALGLPSNYVDGSSLEKLGKKEQQQPQTEPKYGFIDEPDNEPDIPTSSVVPPPSSDQLHDKVESSEHSESSDDKSKKRKEKKHKKHKSKSKKHRDSDSDSDSDREEKGRKESKPKRRHDSDSDSEEKKETRSKSKKHHDSDSDSDLGEKGRTRRRHR